MILDISQIGGFLNNVINRKKFHSPLYLDGMCLPVFEGMNEKNVTVDEWIEFQNKNPNTHWGHTNITIPKILL